MLGMEVDQTLAGGKTYNDALIDREIQQELAFQKSLRTEIKAEQFERSKSMETLRTDLTDDELLQLYEDHVGEVDSLSGRPTSARDAQWYVNPNHLTGHTEAPTLQSIGKTHRYGRKSKVEFADKDKIAHNNFPVTLGSSYELCALNYPASEPMNVSAPPSMRRSKSATRTHKFRSYDRSFNDKADIDRLYLLTKEAPVIGRAKLFFTDTIISSLLVYHCCIVVENIFSTDNFQTCLTTKFFLATFNLHRLYQILYLKIYFKLHVSNIEKPYLLLCYFLFNKVVN